MAANDSRLDITKNCFIFCLMLGINMAVNKKIFFDICLAASIVLNFGQVLSTIRRGLWNLNSMVFKYILLIFLFKNPNPFFHLAFFWIPFPNFFRGAIIFYSSLLIFKKTEEEEVSTVASTFTKKKLTYCVIFLLIVKGITILYDMKLFIYTYHPQRDVIRNQKFYIAANLFNNEEILPDWTSEMTKLIMYLGPDNVYVSIFENGDSVDSTGVMLKNFEESLNQLGVINKIVTKKQIYKGNKERIVFLSSLRSKAMEFIYQIPELNFNQTVILFFNDIIFNYEDIIRLITTNNQDYSFACGFDFYESFYDTWVSIGVDGNQFRYYYPYFINKVAQDLYINGEPIRVFSCWNGVAIMKAQLFEERRISFRYGRKLRQSECTLLIADMRTEGYHKVIANPWVKVAYEYRYYYRNRYVYPWTKNLVTYFYYYFKYFFEKENFNFANVSDSWVELSGNLEYFYQMYLKQ